jgi:hypothetical protein
VYNIDLEEMTYSKQTGSRGRPTKIISLPVFYKVPLKIKEAKYNNPSCNFHLLYHQYIVTFIRQETTDVNNNNVDTFGDMVESEL